MNTYQEYTTYQQTTEGTRQSDQPPRGALVGLERDGLTASLNVVLQSPRREIKDEGEEDDLQLIFNV